MALSDISLTAGMRGNLLALQTTATLLDRTQSRLSTGKKVNTALDNPTNFFSAQANTQRANDLSTRKDAMSEAVQGVQAANTGITGITALIEAAKGLTQAAQSADSTNRNALAGQFNTVLTQITQLAEDSGYKGKNFLGNDTLQVLFNENGSSSLAITGFSATASGLSIVSVGIGTTGVATGTSTFLVSPAISMHTGVVVAASSTGIAQTSYYNVGGGVVTGGTAGSGFTGAAVTIIDFSGAFTGSTGLVSGLGSISGVTINGVVMSGADLTAVIGAMTGFASGQIHLNLSGVLLTGFAPVTGVSYSVSVNFAVKPVNSDGTTGVAAVSNTFALASGDLFSGLKDLSGVSYTGATISSGLSGTTITGPYVSISGVFVNPNQYTISQSGGVGYITFATGVIPANGTVEYGYNTGFTTAGGLAPSSSTFTAQTLTTGQSISAVYANGVALSGTQYTVSGSSISITTGAGFTAAIGKTLSYAVTTVVTGGWASDTGISASVDQLNTAIDTLRTQSANLASNLNVVNTRQDFTNGMIAVLQKGADNLTLADMNEEGANMLMLQTRQQLGTTSLKMASDAAQSVLRLF